MVEENEDCYSSLEEYFLDCARYGDLDELNYCLDEKVDLECVDPNLNNAIHMCSANGHTKILEILLKTCKENGKIDLVNNLNSSGNTPLHWSVICNKIESIKQLVNYDIDYDIKNQKGQKAFDLAIDFCYTDIVELLAPKTDVGKEYQEVDTDETFLVKDQNEKEEDVDEMREERIKENEEENNEEIKEK